MRPTRAERRWSRASATCSCERVSPARRSCSSRRKRARVSPSSGRCSSPCETGSSLGRASGDRPRLAIDRTFSARGRGAVVTGSLRGGPVEAGATLRIEPGAGEARVREVQVHGGRVDRSIGGRTALNLSGVDADHLHRGLVLTTDPGVVATDRLLVALRPPADLVPRPRRRRESRWPPAGLPVRLHLGTDQVDAIIDRGRGTGERFPWGEAVARVRLARPIAASVGDRFVLREPASGLGIAGGRVLDPRPPVGASRRRSTTERLAGLAHADSPDSLASALLDLHGALSIPRWHAVGGADGPSSTAAAAGQLVLARDVIDGLAAATLATVDAHHDAEPASAGIALGPLRTAVALDLRRRVSVAPPEANGAAAALLDGLIAAGRLARDGDRVRDPRRVREMPDTLVDAMARLEALLAVPTPPPFADAVRAAACPPEAVQTLERSGRIVRLSPDLAYAATTYRDLARQAVAMAASGPLTPAAFRDATGTSRKYVMAILEELDARGVLVRTAEGHIPGPRAGTLEAGG